MPYQWIDPELFVEHQGVAVYHCYDAGDLVSQYWYTTEITDCQLDAPLLAGFQFDVRDLPNGGLDPNDFTHHRTIIAGAIEAGLIIGRPHAPSVLSRVVKIVVRGGVAEVVEKSPGVEVEIIDYDVLAVEDPEGE